MELHPHVVTMETDSLRHWWRQCFRVIYSSSFYSIHINVFLFFFFLSKPSKSRISPTTPHPHQRREKKKRKKKIWNLDMSTCLWRTLGKFFVLQKLWLYCFQYPLFCMLYYLLSIFAYFTTECWLLKLIRFELIKLAGFNCVPLIMESFCIILYFLIQLKERKKLPPPPPSLSGISILQNKNFNNNKISKKFCNNCTF